jgi:hypothetical protein
MKGGAFMEKMEPREVLTLTNPNKGWVVNELDQLLGEWRSWLETARHLPDSPDYNPQTCSEAIEDGFANRQKHAVLGEKLWFLSEIIFLVMHSFLQIGRLIRTKAIPVV